MLGLPQFGELVSRQAERMEMPVPDLTEDVAIQALRDFFRGKPFLFF